MFNFLNLLFDEDLENFHKRKKWNRPTQMVYPFQDHTDHTGDLLYTSLLAVGKVSALSTPRSRNIHCWQWAKFLPYRLHEVETVGLQLTNHKYLPWGGELVQQVFLGFHKINTLSTLA